MVIQIIWDEPRLFQLEEMRRNATCRDYQNTLTLNVDEI